MSSASHGVWEVRRPAAGWAGLFALVLLVACGGDRREASGGGTEGAAVTDTAATSPADTGAAPADSSAVATNDTAAKPSSGTTAPGTAPGQQAAPQDTGKAATDSGAPGQGAAPSGETTTSSEPLRDAYHQAPKDTVDQATYNGWKQYNLNCARCHGEDVLGTTIAPHLLMSLKPDGPINTQEAFVQTVCAGRPEKGMPSWCSLGMDPEKINQIYSYVKGRSEGKIKPGRPAVKQEG